jgi:diguanylate cyclase (GGDEF)-like protein
LPGADAAAALVDSDRAQNVSEAIRGLAAVMERAELDMLSRDDVRVSRRRYRSLTALWCLTALAFTGAIAASWQLRRDVTRWRRAEQELRFAVGHDNLTGLYNRGEFERALSQALISSRRTHRPFAIASVDVDHFKQINDSLGHQAGDRVLKALALRLRDALRAHAGVRNDDLIARVGGEEFGVILHGVDESGARQVAERLRESVATQPISLTGAHKGRRVSLTVSIGVAVFRETPGPNRHCCMPPTRRYMPRSEPGVTGCVWQLRMLKAVSETTNSAKSAISLKSSARSGTSYAIHSPWNTWTR